MCPQAEFPLARDACLFVLRTSASYLLVQQYRSQEEIARTHDIENMSKELDQLARVAKSAHGGLPGEMLRRQIREADPAKYEEAQAELAKLRSEALAPN